MSVKRIRNHGAWVWQARVAFKGFRKAAFRPSKDEARQAEPYRRPARDAAVRRLVLALIVVFIAATPALSQDRTRVDLYAPDGKRQGYAIVDRETGRVDFYDPSSRRTGYGKVDDTGRVERFDLKGRREPAAVVPTARRQTR